MKTRIKYICIVIILSFIFFSNSYILIEDTEGIKYFNRININDTFHISSIHSVSKTEIIEEYKIAEDLKINNISTRYFDQGGAGLPDTSDNIIIDSDGSFLKEKSYLMDNILIYVDNNSESKLYNNNDVLNLSNIKNKWMTYEVNIININYLEYLYIHIRMWFNEI